MKAATTLSFARSLSLSVGMALATSCFGMIAGLASTTGWWLLPAMACSLLIALAVAHAIGRLAKRFPSALGVRTYIKAAFGNTASLFFVFLYLFMIALVAGVESNLYASIVQQLVPGLDARLVIAAVFASVLLLNVRGHEFSRNAQLVLVAAMLLGIVALAVTGFVQQPTAVVQLSVMPAELQATQAAQASQLANMPAAAIGAFFLFVGFEWVTSAQPASRQAATQLPRVLLVAVLVLGLVYMAFAAAALTHLGAAQLAGTRSPQMLLAALLWGSVGRWVMLAVSTAAVLMAFNAGVLGASRLIYGLAREGCLPRSLSATLPGSGAPARALALVVGASLGCSLLVQALQASDLFANVAALAICICYAGLLAASLKLARRESAAKAALAPAIEGGALLAMVLLLSALLLDPQAWPQTAFAACACAVLLGCARLVHLRSAKPIRQAPAHAHVA
jgi:amino acid efflux transporter